MSDQYSSVKTPIRATGGPTIEGMGRVANRTVIEWAEISRCPACLCAESRPVGMLSGTEYVCQDQRILFPDGGIPVVRCPECGLVYKSVVLSPRSILSICQAVNADVWVIGYDFREEIRLVQRLVGKDEFDLLDIGAAGGSLLKACAQYPGRRSAMDVTRDDRLGDHLRGEFIQGWLEDEDLVWAGKRYDVVTMFDVAEHLYDAHRAFRRLRDLVKDGGIVILETGDVESSRPARFGIDRWWYVHRFPHNIFWSVESLTRTVERYDFHVIGAERKRNKNLKLLSRYHKTHMLARSSLYGLSPRFYGWCLTRLGKAAIRPIDPLAKDHIRVTLRAGTGRSRRTG
jgi:SAM-dependent methyltransferase